MMPDSEYSYQPVPPLRCRDLLAALIFLAVAIVSPAHGEAVGNSLEIDVSGVRTNAGSVIVSICKAGEAFPSHCSLIRKTMARQGMTIVKVEGIGSGRHALAMFHDENSDGHLDLMHEGIGFSNNVNRKWAVPNFDSSAFNISGNTKINVQMWYQR
jgi:uncharacterized protein (DUF2141 family)